MKKATTKTRSSKKKTTAVRKSAPKKAVKTKKTSSAPKTHYNRGLTDLNSTTILIWGGIALFFLFALMVAQAL